MEEITTSFNNFIKSIENNDNINTIQNNLSLLIGQINIFYYKYNFLNSETCTKIDNNITLEQLEKISEQIRNIYPKFVEIRKAQFKNIYLDKLQCNNNPIELIDNISRTNKIQSMLSDLTDLLYFNSSDMINEKNINISNSNIISISNINDKIKSSSILFIMLIILIVFVIIVFLALFLIKRYKDKKIAILEE